MTTNTPNHNDLIKVQVGKDLDSLVKQLNSKKALIGDKLMHIVNFTNDQFKDMIKTVDELKSQINLFVDENYIATNCNDSVFETKIRQLEEGNEKLQNELNSMKDLKSGSKSKKRSKGKGKGIRRMKRQPARSYQRL